MPWLQATPDPITTATWQTWLEINVYDAEKLEISEGDVISVTSASGKSIDVLAFPHPGVPPGVLSVPIGQGHISGGRYSEDRGSNIMSILTPNVDEESGALAWAATKVRIEKTGEWMRVPKLENTFSEFPRDENQHIIKVTPDEGSSDH
ncbi:MAG: molybdopterin dinucleotide binding domain-containing protein [Dehalococcoidia bacterium]